MKVSIRALTVPGQNVYLTGAFCGWSVQDGALALRTGKDTYPIWSNSFTLSVRDAKSIECKFILVDRDKGDVVWEPFDGNRVLSFEMEDAEIFANWGENISLKGASSFFANDETAKKTAIVVFLHGLGAEEGANDWLARADNKLNHVKWVFPLAAKRPITWLQGQELRAWADVPSASLLEAADWSYASMQDAYQDWDLTRDLIEELIAQNIATLQVPSDRVVLAGFSMGGAASLWTALRRSHQSNLTRPLAGFAAINSFFPSPNSTCMERHSDPSTQYLLMFNSGDPVVNPSHARRAEDMLLNAGSTSANLKIAQFDTQSHDWFPESVQYFLKWLAETVPA
mmetsp:Transcript_14473/g.24065  ORF Transcript_14473/g.24065 Transcript_14473/m.24065 type:complete len:341 (-) Transcript_14473:339-1361(-)